MTEKDHMHMHIASHHNLSLQLIHKFFFLLPVKSFKDILQNTDAATELQICSTSMLSEHNCPKCEVCPFPSCGLDPNFHYQLDDHEGRQVLASKGTLTNSKSLRVISCS